MPKIKSPPADTDEIDQYEAKIIKLQRYINIYSMIEQYKNGTFKPYNTSINANLTDWKY